VRTSLHKAQRAANVPSTHVRDALCRAKSDVNGKKTNETYTANPQPQPHLRRSTHTESNPPRLQERLAGE
jgi:hypothetical protein